MEGSNDPVSNEIGRCLKLLSRRAAAPTPTSRLLATPDPSGDEEGDGQHDNAKGDSGLRLWCHRFTVAQFLPFSFTISAPLRLCARIFTSVKSKEAPPLVN